MSGLQRVAVVVLAWVTGGCTQLNASHCGNQQGDLTCEARDGATPFCDQCEPVNDGCVATRPTAPGCGGQSSEGVSTEVSELTTTAFDSTNGSTITTTTPVTATGNDSSSGPDIPEDCGNGEIDRDEACDGSMLTPETSCTAMGFGEGTPSCAVDCSAVDYSRCPGFVECGDGQIGPGEECDGAVLAMQECADFRGFSGGVLACTDECTFDTSGCMPCVASGESCVSGQSVCCDAEDTCGGAPTQCCQGLGCLG